MKSLFVVITIALQMFTVAAQAFTGTSSGGGSGTFEGFVFENQKVVVADRTLVQQGFVRSQQPAKVQWNSQKFLLEKWYVKADTWSSTKLVVEGRLENSIEVDSVRTETQNP